MELLLMIQRREINNVDWTRYSYKIRKPQFRFLSSEWTTNIELEHSLSPFSRGHWMETEDLSVTRPQTGRLRSMGGVCCSPRTGSHCTKATERRPLDRPPPYIPRVPVICLGFLLAVLAVITFANDRCFRLAHILFRTVTRNFVGQDTNEEEGRRD
jgi:hypothetical protein